MFFQLYQYNGVSTDLAYSFEFVMNDLPPHLHFFMRQERKSNKKAPHKSIQNLDTATRIFFFFPILWPEGRGKERRKERISIGK